MFAKQTCHGAKRSMLASRRHVVRTIFRLRTNKRSPPKSCRDRRPRRSVSIQMFLYSRERTVEDACPYNVYGGRCAAVLFCSRRLFYVGGYGIRPYGAEQNIICRGDHWSPVTLSALSFGFNLGSHSTKGSPV